MSGEEFTGCANIVIEILDRNDMSGIICGISDRQVVFTSSVVILSRIISIGHTIHKEIVAQQASVGDIKT
jgi:hypothetical protein